MEEEVVPVLYVEDAARAVAWYGRLGFVKEWEHQFEPGFPYFVSVARGNLPTLADPQPLPECEQRYPGAWRRLTTGPNFIFLRLRPRPAPAHGRRAR